MKCDIWRRLTRFRIRPESGIENAWAGILTKAFLIIGLVSIGGVIWYKRNYYKKEIGINSVITTLEGVDHIGRTMELFDAVDFSGPNKESGVFFIITKALATDQKPGNCTDSADGGQPCLEDKQCIKGLKTKNGLVNGECNKAKGLCNVTAWCPIEDAGNRAITRTPKLNDITNITVYVKNNIAFLGMEKYEQNYDFTKESDHNCRYDRVKNPLCPVFEISKILREMGISYTDVKDHGATFAFSIEWECYCLTCKKPCTIKYEFKQMVTDKASDYDRCKNRYAKYNTVNGTRVRTKISATGLRFVVLVKSVGYSFGVLKLMKAVGSYMSCLTVAMIIAYSFLFRCCLTDEEKELAQFRNLKARDEEDKKKTLIPHKECNA